MTRPECPNCLRPKADEIDRPAAHLCSGGADCLRLENARLVDPAMLPPLWFAYYEEYKDEGSQVVAAMDEDVAARVGAIALGRERPDPEGIGVAPCDPHAMATGTRDLRAGFAACWADVERLQRPTDADKSTRALQTLRASSSPSGPTRQAAELGISAIARLTRERDAAVARADKAEADFAAALDAFEKSAVIARETWERERERADKACGLLAKCREYLPDAQDSIYGSYCGGDPRDFAPDRDCCTPAELEAHRVACEAAERGEPFEAVAHHHDVIDVPGLGTGVASFASSFGVGIRTVRDPGLERLHAAIDTLLGKDPDHG